MTDNLPLEILIAGARRPLEDLHAFAGAAAINEANQAAILATIDEARQAVEHAAEAARDPELAGLSKAVKIQQAQHAFRVVQAAFDALQIRTCKNRFQQRAWNRLVTPRIAQVVDSLRSAHLAAPTDAD